MLQTPGGRSGRGAIVCFVAAVALIIARSPLLAQPTCPGDCNGDGNVGVNELVIIVDIALGNMPLSQCPAADVDGDGHVMINEMVDAVDDALNGCPPAPPDATATAAATAVSTAISSSTSTPASISTPTPTSEAATPVGASCGNGGTQFSSTYAAIQQQIFVNHGCTQQACHGTTVQAGAQGMLDLLPDVAYQNIFQQPSSESGLLRIDPGEELKSYLYLKLLAATNPSAVPAGTVSGSPMPFGLPPLSASELDALRLWIVSGAPQTGVVEGTEAELNACLPTPAPIVITPLDPPPNGTGVQFVMPNWPLEAHSEHENCFATYYDITPQVPQKYQDPGGTMFRFSSQELRMDPESHHMILNRFVGDASNVHDPSFGAWTCHNNPATEGQPCEPTDLASCGDGGVCTSEIKKSFACIGFGPQIQNPPFYAIGGAQKAQFSDEYPSGVYAQIPMKGILYWNSHAFNLTDQNTVMHGRLNYYFSNDDQLPVQPIFDKDDIFGMNAAPFTTQTICYNFGPLPQGARLFEISSHTHKHGQHFTVCANGQPSSTMGSGVGECSGPLIYDSRIYNDPVNQQFNPPLAFDSPDPSLRTLQYCSFYNNGVATDGSPDTNLVERSSLIPPSAIIGACKPVACVAGQIGAPCKGKTDNSTCDSLPAKGDGLCDACKLTGGESTENDMFILIGSYYVDPAASGQSGTSAVPALSAEGHSLSTELTLPMQASCACSYTAQAAMVAAEGAADK